MMRPPRLMALAIFALSITLIAGSAMAQPGGRGGSGGRGGMMGGRGGMMGGGGMMGRSNMMGGGVVSLLRAEVVRTELGIDDATVEKLQESLRESMGDRDRGGQGARGDRPQRGEGGERGDRPQRGEGGERGDRPQRGERGDRPQRGEGGERGDRPQRGQSGDRGGRPDFSNMSDEDREAMRARMEEMRAQMQERQKEMEKKVAEIIGMEKFGRLKEIELQVAGVQALLREDVQEYLGLTDEQKAKLQEIMQTYREKQREQMQSMFSGGFRDMSEDERRAAFEKMRTAREEGQKKLEQDLMGVLTDDQKTKLGEMMGKPFAKMEELQEQMRSGFGRGGDRGGQGRQQGPGGRTRGGDRPQRPS